MMMTLDEAIRHCDEKSDCTECGYEHKQLADWLRQLKKLQEQQIPKEPYMESDGDADGYPVWDYYCPSCNEYFDEYQPKHCWKCGQAIDWSEVD